VNCN